VLAGELYNNRELGSASARQRTVNRDRVKPETRVTFSGTVEAIKRLRLRAAVETFVAGLGSAKRTVNRRHLLSR
jgi:hypothetical protein